MVAVPNADAYEQVMALVHEGRLTAIDGEAFVVVGDFADARQGHALGRALQRRLRLPFELVYDALHPQADLAWAPRAASPPPDAFVARSIVAEPVVAESLIYLYADPQTSDQQALLSHYLKQPKVLAEPAGVRVGVFRETATGIRAFRQRQADLQALGIPLQRFRRTPGSSLAMAFSS
jgi:hypothetical protein